MTEERSTGVEAVFVDDTKQRSRRTGMGEVIALGAVIVPFENVKSFSDAVTARFDRDGIPHTVELKWSPSPRGNWFRDTGNQDLLTPLRQDVLQIAMDQGVKAVVVAWDKSLAALANGKDPETNVIEWLWERVSMLIENREHIGFAVFDKPGGDHRAEDKWITDTVDLTESGTAYVHANAIVMPFLTAPSHHHWPIQLADLIAGGLVAAVCGSKYGLELIPQIKPLLHRNALGSVGATGLKLWPESLSNLYHWVLDESDYSKTSRMAGVSLPSTRFRHFQTDDGLPAPTV